VSASDCEFLHDWAESCTAGAFWVVSVGTRKSDAQRSCGRHCIVPACPDLADDLHEPLTRARCGSITSDENTVPMCRRHNDDLAQRPESELGWAYALGLLVHSWDAGRNEVARDA
jgi:hypothetical protein